MKHLKDVNMTYMEHWMFACIVALKLFLLSLISLIHGIFPFIFTRMVSDGIKSLDLELWTERNDKDAKNNSGSL